MEPCQCLEEEHSKSDTLESVEDTEPKPEAAAEKGSRDVAVQDPWDVETDVGG